MTEKATRAQLAAEGSIRGPDANRSVLDYIDELFSYFDPNNITDEEIDFVVFLANLRDAFDPESNSAVKLLFEPRQGLGCSLQRTSRAYPRTPESATRWTVSTGQMADQKR